MNPFSLRSLHTRPFADLKFQSFSRNLNFVELKILQFESRRILDRQKFENLGVLHFAKFPRPREAVFIGPRSRPGSLGGSPPSRGRLSSPEISSLRLSFASFGVNPSSWNTFAAGGRRNGEREGVLICAGDVMAGFEHPVHGGISTVRHRDPPTYVPIPFVFRFRTPRPSSTFLLLPLSSLSFCCTVLLRRRRCLLLLQVANVPADSVDLYDRRR